MNPPEQRALVIGLSSLSRSASCEHLIKTCNTICGMQVAQFNRDETETMINLAAKGKLHSLSDWCSLSNKMFSVWLSPL
jgi:hypothetical protein